MIQILMPETCRKRRLTFFLALEEWVARRLPEAEYFFTWTVDPTVIIGRNQSLETEVDTAYCRDNGIDICRRRSGGGCVYADRNNLMLSYIAPGIDVPVIFASYASQVAAALRSLGVPAVVSGRNDITVGGSKISGSAFYRLDNRSIAHGTLLWQVDAETMSHAITPSRAKLESKRVKSVESRVAGISGIAGGDSLGDFAERLTAALCDSEYILTDGEIAQVETIAARYHVPGWLEGREKDSGHGRVVRGRIDGVGEFDIYLMLHDGEIFDIDIKGDYFALSDPRTGIADRLVGSRCDRESLKRALDGADVSAVIAGLQTDHIIDLLVNNQQSA